MKRRPVPPTARASATVGTAPISAAQDARYRALVAAGALVDTERLFADHPPAPASRAEQVLIRIDTAAMRAIAQRGRKRRREASRSAEAQAYLNALEYWALTPEKSARGRKGR